MPEFIDASICPICGEPNRCGELNPQFLEDGRCWCAFETFPPAIFDRVPEDLKDKACICKKCLDRFKSGQPLNRRGEDGV